MNHQVKAYLYKNLAFLRKKKGMSQQYVADALGINQKRYAAWEENRNEPGILNLITLSQFFKLSIDDLLLKDLTI
jgi:transcriptional regulator with XRE-family HTH domain